jgi:hypothetical protein
MTPPWAALMTTLARALAPALLAEGPDPLGTLGSVGVVGAVAVLALIALQAVYKAQIATLQETVSTERARADRYEAEVRDLNSAIRGQVLTALTEATTTQREAIQAIRKGR